MTKYIDAERFVEYFGDWYTEEGTEIGYVGPIKDLVFRMPAADVVEVVRCKDCDWYREDGGICVNAKCSKSYYGCRVREQHFCSYGERRSDV